MCVEAYCLTTQYVASFVAAFEYTNRNEGKIKGGVRKWENACDSTRARGPSRATVGRPTTHFAAIGVEQSIASSTNTTTEFSQATSSRN